MILPDRCSIMNLLASWASSKAAVRLTDTIGSHRSRPKSSRRPAGRCRRVDQDVQRAERIDATRAMAAGTPGWVRSAATNSRRRPACSISLRVVPSSSARPTAKTSAPALARAREKARPRPVLPPVTRAFRPARENRPRLKSVMSMGQLPSEVRRGPGAGRAQAAGPPVGCLRRPRRGVSGGSAHISYPGPQPSQRTAIGPPGAGQGQGLRFGRHRVAFCGRQRPPGLHGQHGVGAPPGPGDLSAEEEGAGPDARGPQRAALAGVRDQQIAVGALQQEIGIAARQQSRGRTRAPGRRGRPPRRDRGSTHRRPGCAPASATGRAPRTPRRPAARPIPAHWANDSGVAGP